MKKLITCSLLLIVMVAQLVWAAHPLQLFVSVLPLQQFVKSIGGDKVAVAVMVREGYSPETYAPTPKQMAQLSDSKIYYRVGVPFERVWLPKIERNYPKLRVVDLRSERGTKKIDPHIWNDPILVMQMAKRIVASLQKLDAANSGYYEQNYQRFNHKLVLLHRHIQRKLAAVKGKILLVYHPAWGYFARRYGLHQVAIEQEGKEPGPKELVKIIELAQQHRVKAIFAGPQFNKKPAAVIARAVKAKLVEINPLAENYLQNMVSVADKVAHYLRN